MSVVAPAQDQSGMSPEEKLRIRMAAENYPHYSTLKDVDSDGEPGFMEDKGRRNKRDSCTFMEQYLCVLLIIGMIVILSLVALVVATRYTSARKMTKTTCDTPDCTILAGNLLEPMNLEADPCSDFYEYACGNYGEAVVVPPDYAKFGQFQTIDQRITSKLTTLLQKNDIKLFDQPSDTVRKLKLYYKNCMKNDLLGTTQQLQDILGELTSSDLLASRFSASSWGLEEAVARAHKMNIDFMFSVGFEADPRNNSVNRLGFDQAGLSLSDYTMFIGNHSEKYHGILKKYYTTVLGILNVEENLARSIVEEVWLLEVKIAQLLMKPEERRVESDVYNLITVDELQVLFGGKQVFDLQKYLTLLLGSPLPSDYKCIVEAKPFIKKLPAFIASTEPKSMANLMSLMFIQGVSRYLSEEYQQALDVLEEDILGITAPMPRWRFCIREVEDIFPYGVGALYVSTEFSEEDREDAEELSQRILKVFEIKLQTTSWMDEETRAIALEKLAAVKLKIGFPPLALNVTALDKRYENLTIGTDSSLKNYMAAINFSFNKNLEKRYKPPEKDKWSMAATEPNAYYSPTKNEMVFPAAILNEPFYSRVFPSAIKFGSMGFIMGHELTHGFDNQGRLFDKHGNMFNWWTNTSSANFNSQTDCLEDQYSEYQVAGRHINGATTLSENIADNGAIRTSYSAYVDYVKDKPEEVALNLPGLTLNDKQLFFLAFAQTWCVAETDEYARHAVVTDVHTHPRFRVIGTLSNTPDFSKAYNCPAGSYMNPAQKCAVWT